MNAMRYRGYIPRIEYADEDHLLVGHIAGINDGVGFHGETVAEVEAAFQKAVDDYIAACASIGKAP